jgi:3-oxoacyl-[acyl-carrier protein] reductase
MEAKQRMDLQGKTVLVTGGSRGIGAAIVRDLSATRASVAFTFRERADAAEDLVEQLSGENPNIAAFRCDSRDFVAVRSTVKQVTDRFGPIYGLVNNAGITRDRLLLTMKPEEWQEVIDTDLTGVFNLCRAVIFSMSKRKQGRIVNIGSVSGITGSPGQVNYSAAKAGVIGLTRALAKETAKLGLTVNVVAPGYIETDMLGGMSDKVREKFLRHIPMGRVGAVRDVSSLVCYLLDEPAGYVTGQVFSVDGGIAI